MPHTQQLQHMRAYFETGITQPYNFRKHQLLLLKKTILKYEEAIMDALFTDLKKSREEAYSTEIGVTLSIINDTIQNLHRWMKPQKVSTNLLNLPASSTIYKDALGVVLIISPWNYPFQLLIGPLIAAIAGGNTVVIKPSEFSVATSSLIEKMMTEIFPPQYVYTLQGEGAAVIPPLLQSFRFDHVFYTGSVAVGKSIYKMAAENLVPVTLELGGKSPCIVEADAQLAVAAKRIVFGKFLNAGQTCIAPDYILAHASIKDALVAELKISIEAFYGNDASMSYDYGKIINEQRFEKLISYLKEGNIIHGGQYNKSKLFIAPTLIENITPVATLMQEEIFGPLLPIMTYTSTAEAKKIVQEHKNPLALYLFTTNKATEKEWLNNTAFGGGCINNTIMHFTNKNLPFGGVGNSGMGAYHGIYGFNTFTRLKPMLKSPNWFNPSMKFPSFKGKLGLLKWLIK